MLFPKVGKKRKVNIGQDKWHKYCRKEKWGEICMRNEIWEWPCSASNTKEIHRVGKGSTIGNSLAHALICKCLVTKCLVTNSQLSNMSVG